MKRPTKMGKTFSVYLVRSNLSGKIRVGYTKKEAAKKNKKILEHVIEVFVKDE